MTIQDQQHFHPLSYQNLGFKLKFSDYKLQSGINLEVMSFLSFFII